MRDRAGGSDHRGERGFTLLEMIIVAAILGMIALIATIAVSNAIKRQRLEVASRQLQSIMEKAYVLTAQRNAGVFMVLTPAYSDGSRRVMLRADTDGDGQISSAELAPYDSSKYAVGDPNNDAIITSDLVVSSCNWPSVTVGGSSMKVLLCDTQGRTLDPSVSPATQFSSALISLTRQDMTTSPPALTPRTRYDITLGALWHSKINEVRY